ncbi:MAG: DUF983 domain-containing protein, partial [bacterium]|nr:DUF983 domain-containing protein [bacterium]
EASRWCSFIDWFFGERATISNKTAAARCPFSRLEIKAATKLLAFWNDRGTLQMMNAPSSKPAPNPSFLDRLATAIWRALRLRCPECGVGRVNANWFRMNDHCPNCQFDFRRESGFFLGSIYFNYGLTGLIVSCVGTPLVLSRSMTFPIMAAIIAIFCVGFPIWFLRYARCLCISLDHLFDGRRQLAPDARETNSPIRAMDEEPRNDELLEYFTCPFCHTHFRFASRARRTWRQCPDCGQQVFLLPSRPRDSSEKSEPD